MTDTWYADLGELAALTETRHRFLDSLSKAAPGSDLRPAALVLAELVSNVHRHAPGPARITFHVDDEAVTLTVANPGPAFIPPQSLPGPDSPGGRGLLLIAGFANPVSVHQTADGWTAVTVNVPLETLC